MKNYIDQAFSITKADVCSAFKHMKNSIILWIIGLMIIQTVVIVTVVKLM